jgi:hypothetical protein
MSQNISMAAHMLIVGDLGTVMTLALGVGAVSSVLSAMSAGFASFLRRKKPAKISVKLPDGTEVKFDGKMSSEEITQKLGSISTNVRSTLQALPKQRE